jgi:hypothetical protein
MRKKKECSTVCVCSDTNNDLIKRRIDNKKIDQQKNQIATQRQLKMHFLELLIRFLALFTQMFARDTSFMASAQSLQIDEVKQGNALAQKKPDEKSRIVWKFAFEEAINCLEIC